METLSRRDHWQGVYQEKGEYKVSWYQETAAVSLALIRASGAGPNSEIIDIGGGASRLIDHLVREGYCDLTVLDLSEAAMSITKARLGEQAAAVRWIAADVTEWQPGRQYDLWHDRAAFHFLTQAADRAAYVQRLSKALKPGGHVIIGTFALDGPERCSGLPVMRHDGASLSDALGGSFKLVESRRDDHNTPMGSVQRFQFSLFRRA
jgi:2-polyprenyl-3-methyl-5-hydroxy-6-metoxy-1,4-benzoquinol methylase